MKKFLLVPLSALAMSFGLFADEPHLSQGAQIMQQVKSSYENGEYRDFLQEHQNAYESAMQEGRFAGVLDLQKEGEALTKEMQKLEKPLHTFDKKLAKLEQERNELLQKVCAEHPELAVSKAVQEVCSYAINDDQKQGLKYIAYLSYLKKDKDRNPLENQLIGINHEYELKALLLASNQAKGGLDEKVFQERKRVLALEKMHKMREVLKDSQAEYAKKVRAADSVFEDHLTYTIDMQYLEELGNGKIQPENEVEKKVQKIMSEYLSKRENLLKKEFPNLQ